MNYSKLLLSALGMFCFTVVYGQNKTSYPSNINSTFTPSSSFNLSQSKEMVTPNTIFITAPQFKNSKSVLKRFNVDAARSGYVQIKDHNSNIVAVVYVEKGLNEILYLCPRGQYQLATADVDMSDPKMTN